MKTAKRLLLILPLAFAVGCGSPSKQTNSGSGGSLPNIAGTWSGTINLQGSTPNLVLVLTEDSAGNLTGSASSTAGCNFSVPVTGAIYSNYSFSVQTADYTLVLAGSLANNNVDASGSVNIGNGPYSCGPASGAPFALGRQ